MFNQYLGKSPLLKPKKISHPEGGKKPSNLTVWKTANLKFSNGRVYLSPLTRHNDLTSFDAEARCPEMDELANSSPFSIPDVLFKALHGPATSKICSCGFYAYHERYEAELHNQNSSSSVLLEVAVSGKFIDYDKGIRFSHQRVKSVTVGACMYCGEQATLFETGLNYFDSEYLFPVCETHRSYHNGKYGIYGKTEFSFEELAKNAMTGVRSGFTPVVFKTSNGEEPWDGTYSVPETTLDKVKKFVKTPLKSIPTGLLGAGVVVGVIESVHFLVSASWIGS